MSADRCPCGELLWTDSGICYCGAQMEGHSLYDTHSPTDCPYPHRCSLNPVETLEDIPPVSKNETSCTVCDKPAFYMAHYKGYCKEHKSVAQSRMSGVVRDQESRDWPNIMKHLGDSDGC
jgi:hypothetical protein